MTDRKFPANNGMKSARSLWYYRVKYKLDAFDENNGRGGIEVKDLSFVERMYYGLIDENDHSINVNTNFLKPLARAEQPGAGLVAVDFVADAFNDFVRVFENACRAGLLNKENPYISKIQARKAYVSPTSDYRAHFNKMLVKMNTTIIPNVLGDENIITFDDYVNTFLNFYEDNYNQIPLSMTKWCRSNYSSVFHSGLAIDISGLPMDSDQAKIDLFIDDPRYKFYSNIAINSGFSIMKDAPWILIADLQSPGISKYLSKAEYNLTDLSSIFKTRYNRSYINDLSIMTESLYTYYNLYIAVNPRVKKLSVCNGKTRQEYITRDPLSRAQYYKRYGDTYWIGKYLKIRNTEDQVGFSERKLQNIKNNSINLYNSLDINRAMEYIDNEYGNQTWNKPYGYTQLLSSLNKGDLRARQKVESQGQPVGSGQPSSTPTGGGSSY